MKRTGFLLGAVSGLAVVANTETVFSQALAQTVLPGLPGADGPPGRDGRARPAPPVFINEHAATPMPAPAQFPPPDALRSRDTRRGAAFTSPRAGEQQ